MGSVCDRARVHERTAFSLPSAVRVPEPQVRSQASGEPTGALALCRCRVSKQCRLKMTDGFRRLTKADNHEAVKIGKPGEVTW